MAEKEGRTALPMCLLPAAVNLEFREQWGAAHTDGSSSRPRTRGRAPERPESACTGEKCRATADSINSAAPRGVEEPRGLSVRMLASPPRQRPPSRADARYRNHRMAADSKVIWHNHRWREGRELYDGRPRSHIGTKRGERPPGEHNKGRGPHRTADTAPAPNSSPWYKKWSPACGGPRGPRRIDLDHLHRVGVAASPLDSVAV